ncbi:DNA gyrase C-terminal beta-propeller domain-containing protein [Actinacidiphila soli]|uniref:DNA gyrase C-terminal beta-propeller domain-containing protein n=1 Tax=Actinacidiphila soli TaxID=2487275 RepID=UPI000FCBDE84|nr:DNA gyrase C-terminal beta-propeller domain-containing protein [Actinacidiphila soli]
MVLPTRRGVIKRLTADYGNKPATEVIALKDDDAVVAAVELATGTEELVAITSDAQLLRTSLEPIRAQGRTAGDDTVTTVTDSGSAKVTPAAECPAKGRGGAGVRCHKFLKGSPG